MGRVTRLKGRQGWYLEWSDRPGHWNRRRVQGGRRKAEKLLREVEDAAERRRLGLSAPASLPAGLGRPPKATPTPPKAAAPPPKPPSSPAVEAKATAAIRAEARQPAAPKRKGRGRVVAWPSDLLARGLEPKTVARILAGPPVALAVIYADPEQAALARAVELVKLPPRPDPRSGD